jgi:iron complex outermembrane receptor protein
MAQPDSTDVRLKLLEIEEVQVTGRRSQAVFSDVSRAISVIRQEEIEKAGIRSFQDLLEFVSNADIRQRGNNGIQADVSIRGGSFDHTMVLVNGINFSDPQTGHVSFDVPVDVEAIQRIEILEGSAARVLGPGAFTGAVNIITNRGNDKLLQVQQAVGGFGYERTHLLAMFHTAGIGHTVSLSRSSSDGYMKNTDFSLQNLYYRGNLELYHTTFDFQTGYQHKHFGAAGFYSPRFPDQYEEADVWIGSLKVTTGTRVKITPAVYWRRRKDYFILVRDNPSFYRNFHLTDVYGSSLNISFGKKILSSSLGFDIRSENILSNNIGFDDPHPVPVKGWDSVYYTKRYSRTNLAYYQEHHLEFDRLHVTTGFMFNLNTAYPDKPALFPGIDIRVDLFRKSAVFFSINRALHLPTFTDMFYTDPVNAGNFDLEPNRMVSYEGGIKYSGTFVKLCISEFYQSGRDMIDWLWSYEKSRFSPVNLDTYKGWGTSASLIIDIPEYAPVYRMISRISVNTMAMGIKKSVPDSVSKYYNLRDKLSVSVIQNLTKKISFSWNVSYQDRNGEMIRYNAVDKSYNTAPYKPFWLLDAAVNGRWKYLEMFVEISNILNTQYIDTGSVTQPGTCLKAGLVLKLQAKDPE